MYDYSTTTMSRRAWELKLFLLYFRFSFHPWGVPDVLGVSECVCGGVTGFSGELANAATDGDL